MFDQLKNRLKKLRIQKSFLNGNRSNFNSGIRAQVTDEIKFLESLLKDYQEQVELAKEISEIITEDNGITTTFARM